MLKCPIHNETHYCRHRFDIDDPYRLWVQKPFCSNAHPDLPDVFCMKLRAHDGPHAAHTFKVSELSEWAT